jgi:cytochrome c5
LRCNVSTKDSDFFKTMSLVLAALGVFFVVIIVAALAITGDDDSAKVSTDPRIEAKTNALIKPVGEVNTDAAAAVSAAAPAPAAGGGAVDAAAEYQSKCFACHGTGAAGAPKLGDKAAWKDRIAAGNDALYNNAINGKGAMPPKGGHASLSDDAIKAIVDHMVSKSK